MRFPRSVAAGAVTLTTFVVATTVGAGPGVAGPANPPPAPSAATPLKRAYRKLP